MPSVEWNKETWAKQLIEYETKGLPFYGAQWGNPDPRAVFPAVLRRLIPETWAAAFLQDKTRRRIMTRLFKPKAPYYPDLYLFIKQYITPYVTPETTIMEIGPGGGRWTSYLLKAKQITLVDIVPQFFDYLRSRFPEYAHKLRFYESSGSEINGIESESINYLLTFDAFVHIEPAGIREYLHEIQRVLTPGAIAVVHYGDVDKPEARKPERSFAPMTGVLMDEYVQDLKSMTVMTHNKNFLLHSNLIVLKKVAS